MLSQQDLDQLRAKGISEAELEKQLHCFETSFPFLRLRAAASIGNGIVAPTPNEQKQYIAAWEAYKQEGHHITKFVPASGAASRMFKNVFEFVDADYEVPTTDFEKKYFENIHDFAFFPALDDACHVTKGKGVDALISEGDYKAVAENMLSENGLNYGQLPKGLLQFHA